MKEYQSLSHTTWDCKYHVVFIPKCRKQRIFGALRRELGVIFRELAGQKESQIVEGHLMPDHVHMCISIPPKYAVAHVVGYLKGKSAIQVARRFGGRQRNFTGEHFWARGYFVSTVARLSQLSQLTNDNSLNQLQSTHVGLHYRWGVRSSTSALNGSAAEAARAAST
jgi:putative transposase